MTHFKLFLLLAFIVSSINCVNASTATNTNASINKAEICGEKDCEFLFKEMKKFAKNGSALAQATVSLMYADGIGTHKDQEGSLKFIKRAARNGLSFAEYSLGMLYREGQLVEKSAKDADYWLQRAAKGNYKPAINLLQSESKIVSEGVDNYQQAAYTPAPDENTEVIVVTADKYSLTDFYELLKGQGLANPSQTGSRIKGRGCGNSASPCGKWDVNSQEGAVQYLLFSLKINR